MIPRFLKTFFTGLAIWGLFFPAVVQAVVEPQPPGAATLNAPSGTLTDRQPEFSWSSVDHASWYRLYITRDGQFLHSGWLEGETAWQPGENLPTGNYRWWVYTWGPGGAGQWSDAGLFEIEANIPGAAALDAPEGVTADRRPVFSWQAVPYAGWYQISIRHNNTQYFTGWVQATSWQSPGNMPSGSYTWWVQAWGPDGLGPWSTGKTFEITSQLPGAASLTAPIGVITDRQPVFTWSAVTHAAWYMIHINRNGSQFASEWTDGATQWSAAEPLPAGAYSWWVRTWGYEGPGPWSDEGTFSIYPEPPGATAPIAPADVSLGPDAAELRPVFSWTAALHASWYRIQLYRDGSLFDTYWVEDSTQWQPESALPGGVFSWQVEGWNIDGFGPQSEPAAFVVTVSEFYALEQRAHQLVNAYRAEQTLPALTWNETIAEVCRGHSQNMADGTVPFGHQGVEARVDQIGLTLSWSSAAENVAWNQGYPLPAETAVEGWIDSPGHLANMAGNFSKTGMGVARNSSGRYYFTQIFILD